MLVIFYIARDNELYCKVVKVRVQFVHLYNVKSTNSYIDMNQRTYTIEEGIRSMTAFLVAHVCFLNVSYI